MSWAVALVLLLIAAACTGPGEPDRVGDSIGGAGELPDERILAVDERTGAVWTDAGSGDALRVYDEPWDEPASTIDLPAEAAHLELDPERDRAYVLTVAGSVLEIDTGARRIAGEDATAGVTAIAVDRSAGRLYRGTEDGVSNGDAGFDLGGEVLALAVDSDERLGYAQVDSQVHVLDLDQGVVSGSVEVGGFWERHTDGQWLGRQARARIVPEPGRARAYVGLEFSSEVLVLDARGPSIETTVPLASEIRGLPGSGRWYAATCTGMPLVAFEAERLVGARLTGADAVDPRTGDALIGRGGRIHRIPAGDFRVPRAPEAEPAEATERLGALRIDVEVPPLRSIETATLTLHLTNESDDPVELHQPSGPRTRVFLDLDGHRAAPCPTPQPDPQLRAATTRASPVIVARMLEPGETWTEHHELDLAVLPGTYELSGRFTAAPRDLVAHVTVHVGDRA